MKTKLLKGIILLITGIITISLGLFIVDSFTNVGIITLEDVFTGIGVCALIVLGATAFAIGWIYIRMFLDERK